MWNNILEYIDSIGVRDEKKSPESTEEYPWMKEERDRIEENKKKLEITKKELDDILLTEEVFEIGDEVEYLKVPNNKVSFRVVMSNHSELIYYPMSGNHALIYIKQAQTKVQYFDSNQILQTITDESKWFKKV